MGSDLLEVLMTSSQDVDGGAVDPVMVLCKSSPVPLNSGVQNVVPEMVRSLNRAKMLRPPYRAYAIEKSKEGFYGWASIGSENDAYRKELNTTRVSQTSLGRVQGQPASAFDKYLYGKKYLENNPKGRDEELIF